MKRERRFFFLPLLILLNVIVLGLQAEATSYTVKAGGGGNYTSISACAAAAVAGDTCTVYAGSYGGWTQSNSGSAAKPITFTANSGDTVNVTSGITLSSRAYITISHFTINGSITGDGTTNHNIITHNIFNTTAFRINDGQGSNGSDNVLSFNTVTFPNHSNNAPGFYVYGDRNLFDSNTISAGGGDCFDLGGANVVVRNNDCHDQDGSTSGEHIDFVQVMGGGTSPTLRFSLVEGNTERNCVNDGGNCHFIIIRTGSGPVADTVIVRSNYAQNLDGTGASFGGLGDNVPHPWFYNNTIATGRMASESGDCASYQNAPYSGAFNNICYNTGAAPVFGIGGCIVSGTTGFCDGDIEFNSGYSGSWDAPYSGEATYTALHNQNPLFANFPTDATLQSGSPAKNAGVALTTASGSGSNSSALTVADAHGLQSGWAGTQADWIRIGASTTVQISSINYSTNAIALASPVSWSKGDAIYLYKDSNGNVVLNGPNPDIGMFDVKGNGNTPPTNLQAIVH